MLIMVIGLRDVVSTSNALRPITIQEALLGHDVGCTLSSNMVRTLHLVLTLCAYKGAEHPLARHAHHLAVFSRTGASYSAHLVLASVMPSGNTPSPVASKRSARWHHQPLFLQVRESIPQRHHRLDNLDVCRQMIRCTRSMNVFLRTTPAG